MRSKRVASGLAVVLMLGFGAVVSSPAVGAAVRPSVTAADFGYPYPNAPDCDESNGAHCVKDMWDFVQGQCHSWVAYRVNQLNSKALHGKEFDDHYLMTGGNEWGNPSNWDTAAPSVGIAMNSTPALGSVAWWAEDGAHVAYVESVNDDGSILISEMNADWHNGFDFATVRPGGDRWPDAFIHIADRKSSSATPLAPKKIRATPSGAQRATVTWNAPAGNGSTVTGYVVTAHPGNAAVTVAAGVLTASVKHLTRGTSYTFTVHATSAKGAGFESAPSNAVVPGS